MAKHDRLSDETKSLYTYSPENAKIYSEIGIYDTTYEIAYFQVSKYLGDLSGQKVLDFGCGSGRSSTFVKSKGATLVVGVDHDPEMIKLAKAQDVPGCEFKQVGKQLPFEDSIFDSVTCVSVLIEVRVLSELKQIFKEIYRVSKPGARFVISTASEQSYNASYYSYSRKSGDNLKSGNLVKCHVKSKEGSFDIIDTYWSKNNYFKALTEANWDIKEYVYPVVSKIQHWQIDEVEKPPYLVILCQK